MFLEIKNPCYGRVKSFLAERRYGFFEPTDVNGKLVPLSNTIWFHAFDFRHPIQGDIPGTVDWHWESPSGGYTPRKGELVVYEVGLNREGKTRATPWTFFSSYQRELAKATQDEFRISDNHGEQLWFGRYSDECDLLEEFGQLPAAFEPEMRIERFVGGTDPKWLEVPDSGSTFEVLRNADRM